MSFDIAKYPTLALVDSIQGLRLLPEESLPRLCDGLRRYLFDSVSRSSGHFASGLDTAKLAMALHYVYSTPFDQLIWDVGHQAYPHKILTRCRNKVGIVRQKGGLHPFPRRSESEYDVLGVGHLSISISAGIGIAIATEKEGKNRRTVCVIGDGVITADTAFEAMSHAGDIRPDMLMILNDNEMSTSESVSALNNHLAQLLSGKLYPSLREGGEKVFPGVSPIKELLRRTEERIKGMVMPGILFEELGFNYINSVNGHNMLGLITTLENIHNLKGPQFLHIMTKKGRGYEPAERDPIAFHAVPKFDPSNGCLPKSSDGLPSYSKIFGDWLCETAAEDNKLMAITPAMREDSGMVEFSRKFLSHYFDVAIAKQHAVTFTAGPAIGGYKPIVAIYSTFLQHTYNQVLHDVATQKLPAPFTIDRAGIVGADGQTRRDAFDLSCLRCISEIVIMTPGDENECRQVLYIGYHYNDGPSAVRYPCDNTVGVELTSLEKLPIDKGIMKYHGEKLAILNFDTLMPEATRVAKSLNAALVDIHFMKPLDEALILEMVVSHGALVAVEENAIVNDTGSGVSEVLMAHRKPVPVLNIGLPDFFVPQGTQEEIHAELGLDVAGMEAKVKAWLAQSLLHSCYT